MPKNNQQNISLSNTDIDKPDQHMIFNGNENPTKESTMEKESATFVSVPFPPEGWLVHDHEHESETTTPDAASQDTTEHEYEEETTTYTETIQDTTKQSKLMDSKVFDSAPIEKILPGL